MAEVVSAELRTKLENKVKAAGHSDKIVSVDEEQKIVNDAVDAGVSVEFAASVVAAICVEKGYCRETELNHIMKVILKNQSKNDGKVDKGEFDQAVLIARELTHERIPIPKLNKSAKQIMIENGIQAKSGGFLSGDWFKAIG